jgi:glycerate dehydrogenase
MMKPSAIIINVARGAVTDEQALADAILAGRIGGLGVDVFSTEPMPENHPFTAISHLDNVSLTPHMAWGSYEARMRCMEEIRENIRTFFGGGIRNRVDLE